MEVDLSKPNALLRHTLLLALAGSLVSGCALRRKEIQHAREPAALTSMSPAEAEAVIYRQVNDYRQSRGLARLTRDRRMSEIAREHSGWMAARGKLSHRGADGRFRRLQDSPTQLRSFAENVAYNLGHDSPAQVAVDGWIRSPGHHSNMIRRDDELTGIGVARARDGSWYLTQLFGRR